MCIFCKISQGEIPSKTVYQDKNFVVINDIMPTAPVHLLIIPRKHIENIMEIDEELYCKMLEVIKTVAKETGVVEKGFRLVVNTGQYGGQTVNHLHIHLLGGREFTWPAG